MVKARSSKAFLLPPATTNNVSPEARLRWLETASAGFVSHSAANKTYYRVILEALWPAGHGIPGPHLTESELRAAVDAFRASRGESQYKDVFRRVRELQGEEGFTSIDKEGTKYQLRSLEVGAKREPRLKPTKLLWRDILTNSNHRCSHCGAQEPDVRLSPDHRVPRARGGSNDDSNWQPLCEQCNNLKSSSCQGCNLNCFTCSWAYPETFKPIVISDDNKELIRRIADKKTVNQSDLGRKLINRHAGFPHSGNRDSSSFSGASRWAATT